MPKFLSTWKIVRLLRHHNVKPLIRNRINAVEAGNYVPIRCLSSIARIDSFYSRDLIHHSRNSFNRYDNLQKRWFLSFGNGEEGNALSKVYEEKLVVGYSPEKLFAVVAAVDLYEDFLPWCQRSEILRHHPNGSFDAELEIGFKFFNESYISHVVLDKPKLVKTTAQSNLFEHLINVWEFRPGPTPDTCNLYFLVDFKFRSPLYRQVASMFFREVVSRLVSSFTDRCRLLYGPGATIEQSA